MRAQLSLELATVFVLLTVTFVQGDYVAAVVQHAVPPRASTPFLTKVGNLHQYAADTVLAKAQGAQVIAFPEFGLTADEDLSSRQTTSAYAEPIVDVSNSTDSEDFANPCLNPVEFENSPSLYYGSCMARNNSIVVLINTFEQVLCNSSEVSDVACPKDGQFVYNTDVLFDEQGNFVAKYRKTHPFYIFSVDAPAQPSLVTYKASFGVTFGLFICFDIAFAHPALDLVQEGVTDFLYAAAIGTIGKGTVAKLWSWANHAHVLLANHGNTASDIIIKGTSAQSQTYQVPNSSDSVIIATVPSA